MNKRILNTHAKAGYFKRANGALYAIARRVLRKPPFRNYASAIDEPEHESLTAFDVPSKTVSISKKTSSPDVRKKHRKVISAA